jgi:peptide/nickel transport system ATP-binding protein
MNQPVLSVRHLCVAFSQRRRNVVAVNDVSLDIARGEVLGVVGESGAGKSLTASAIVGLLEPPGRVVDGEIWLTGQRIDGLAPDAMRRIRGKRVGMVFQDPLTSLNPLYRIGDQLVETIKAHTRFQGIEARHRAIALLTEVGLPAAEARIDNYPHQFSGGMRQRVVLALALAGDPELVIADEPTTALDVSIQAQIIALLKRLCRERGTAIMLITHDMGVIAEAADRVAVMYAGRIVEIGTVRDVIKRPLHPYSVGLMGSIPRLDSDLDRLIQISGSMPRLNSIPSGCAFHPRCPRVFEPCSRTEPQLIPHGQSRVACWIYDDVAKSVEAVLDARTVHSG